MQVIVSLKIVPDDEDITVNADRTLCTESAKLRISEYDLNAIEAATALSADNQAKLIALTVGEGAVDNSKIKKNILSLGPEELVVVADDALQLADNNMTAKALAAAIKQIDGGADLVICGDGSADIYSRQVDAQLAELLGVPAVSGVVDIKVEGDTLICDRVLEDEIETVAVSLPAVVSVVPDIAKPRIPGMKDILAAGKKPASVSTLTELQVEAQPTLQISDILAPEPTPRALNVFEDIDEFCKAVAAALV